MTKEQLIKEVQSKYGSVGKMISIVTNEVSRLNKYGGYSGRDGADTLERALRLIPREYHSIYYSYAHSTYKP